MDPVESLSDIIRVAQRMLAVKIFRILCAWRADIPEVLQLFREIFAQILHPSHRGVHTAPGSF